MSNVEFARTVTTPDAVVFAARVFITPPPPLIIRFLYASNPAGAAKNVILEEL
jgi:hypothetical protein